MGPMVSEPSLQRYRKWYAKLLRLYPRQYRERFGEAMEQTFNDLYRERIKAERGLLTFVLWIFLETSAGIIRENATMLMRWSMKRGPTIFLRIVISGIGVAAFAVCIFALPKAFAREAAKTPDTAWVIYLFLAAAYVMVLAFFVALYQAFKLLSYIDGDKAFSELSVRALGRIKYCAITISFVMVAGILGVMALTFGTGEDMAGQVAMGLVVTLASSVVATFTAVLQKQVQKAVDMKKEGLS